MKTLVVAAALITKGGRILVTQREERDDWGLLWEFPGGTLEEDEGPHECIKRELREELGIGVEIEGICQVVYKRYEGFNILLLAYQCTITEGIPSAIRCREVRENYNPKEKLYLFRQDYTTSTGKEIFLSYENKDRTKLENNIFRQIFTNIRSKLIQIDTIKTRNSIIQNRNIVRLF